MITNFSLNKLNFDKKQEKMIKNNRKKAYI